MSHEDEEGRTRQNIGYWGLRENCMPVEGAPSNVSVWVPRAKNAAEMPKCLGTALHIVGFHAVKNWEQLLTASILENFFGAIWKGALVVEINARTISKETIHDLFEDESVRASLEGAKGQSEGFDNAKSYFATLASAEEVLVEDSENREIGNCQIRILLGDQLPKRVAILRNGMLITDQMDRLKRFPDFKEFAAVIECHNKKGNELLRDMEPPRHNDFEPDRLSPENIERGRRALIELARWAREMLKRHARDPVSEISDVRELADYFADDGEETGGQKGEEVNPIGKIEIRAQPMKRPPVTVRTDEEDEDEKQRGAQKSGKGTKSSKAAKSAGKSSNHIHLNNFRSVTINEKRRRIAITPDVSGNIELVLYEAGADTDRRLNVVKTSVGSVRSGIVRNLRARRGSRMTLEVELDAKFLGAMKVAANAI
ncbi:hypothetical protein IVA80_25790 [Bradyrhizobium sp. 139]|uniref:hypothetical protein n=1 Tax=Bradyrhizobium sp. 139 TaxID=2782616 RepID=UPI001FFBD71B|nr:hypothetical protein [Bradyrhizobium sp. 139]MCK1744155.1 hypothetical protein [Bradyrhizobium sp. 139]